MTATHNNSARVSFTEAKASFSDTMLRATKGERILLTHHGTDRVAVISADDLALLEQLEDLLEDEWAREAAKKALEEGGKPIPAEKVWRSLGL